MNEKIRLHEIQVPSTDFLVDAALCQWKKPLTLQFEYSRDGTVYRSGILFKRVLAIRTRAERCCTPWHIEEAYDTLVEVTNSSWTDELRSETKDAWRNEWETHHYMICLDSAGCFEVIAESWELIPEERGSWS